MTDKEKQAIEQLLIDKEFVLNGCSTAIISIDDLETVLNLVESQTKELEKKDKMIDLILEEIVNNHCSIRDIVAEEICDDRCVGNNNWTCFKHIKEYFERKVEEDGNKNTEIG